MHMLALPTQLSLRQVPIGRQQISEAVSAKSSNPTALGGRSEGYPSPPMSNPSSPPRSNEAQPPRASISETFAPARSEATGERSYAESRPSLGAPPLTDRLPHTQQQEHRQQDYYRPHGHSTFNPVLPSPSYPDDRRFSFQGPSGQYAQVQLQQNQPGVSAPASPTSAGALVTASGVRPARRTKTHVKQACVNCKKAHLSCGEQRPCPRCISTGKQDSCRDEPHKKRGRPSLRANEEPRSGHPSLAIEQMGRSTTSSSISRGHRRGNSLRVLRSQGATGGGIQEEYAQHQPMLQPQPQGFRPGGVPSLNQLTRFRGVESVRPQPFSSLPPPRLESGPGSPIGVAFVNLNLQILRANSVFRDLLVGTGEIHRRELSDFLDARHGQDLQHLQTSLRDERNSKEEYYLPPPMGIQGEQEAVQNLAEADLDGISQGFSTRRYNWTFILARAHSQPLQVMVRLARTSIFFATVVVSGLPVYHPPPSSAFAFSSNRAPPPRPITIPGPGMSLTSTRSPREMGFQPMGPPSPFSASGHSAPPSPFTNIGTLSMSLPPSSLSVPTFGTAPVTQYEPGYFQGYQLQGTGPSMHPPHYPPPSRTPSITSERRQSLYGDSSQADSRGYTQLRPIVTTSSSPAQAMTSQGQDNPRIRLRDSPQERGTDEDLGRSDSRKRRRVDISDITEH